MSEQPTGADFADAAAGSNDGGGIEGFQLSTETQQPDSNSGMPEGINPAWNELLGKMPSSLHSQMIPDLRKWDENVQQRFAKVQPYQSFIDEGIPPEQLTASMQLAQMIATNPREFYDRLTQRYAEEWGLNGQGQQEDAEDEYSLDGLEDDDVAANPYVKQLKQQQDMIATVLANDLQQRQEREAQAIQREAESQLEAEISEAQEKYGKFSDQRMKMTLSLAAQIGSFTQAAEMVAAELGVTKNASIPPIVPPSGGVPMQNVDPATFDNKQTRGIVEQILARAAQANKE